MPLPATLPTVTSKKAIRNILLHHAKLLLSCKKKFSKKDGFTLILLTKLAVLLVTSLANCMKCLLVTGFSHFFEAALQALHSSAVSLAITVAAESTCTYKQSL